MKEIKRLKELNTEFKAFLKDYNDELVRELQEVMDFNYLKYYSPSNKEKEIVAFLFEYDWENLSFYGFAFDNEMEPLASIKLPVSQKPNKNNEDYSSWFYPKHLYDESIKLIDIVEESDEDLDYDTDDWSNEKNEIFENWFKKGWEEATKKKPTNLLAFFSVHDTNFRTDLSTMEEILDSEMEKRIKAK